MEQYEYTLEDQEFMSYSQFYKNQANSLNLTESDLHELSAVIFNNFKHLLAKESIY